MESFIERLNLEFEELTNRMTKLESFIGTEKFNDLSYTHQALLQIQYNAMTTYHQCLESRLILLKSEQ